MNTPRLLCVGLVAALGTACASSGVTSLRYECQNPDRQLEERVRALDVARANGCHPDARGSDQCAVLTLEIERLTVVCPGHLPTLLANAVIAYDAGETARAQQFLDELFERPRSAPDAAMLRARIAIDEGNLPFARRFTEEQIQLAPDHSGLREVHASALYLLGQLDDARRELVAARTLGAPSWRVAYHLGLIDEAAGQLDLARQDYAQAVEGNPGWAPAVSRLAALGAPSSPQR